MDKQKFTKGPWEKRRKTIGDFIGISIFSENCPIGLIAKLPFKNEFALIREYKEKFSQEEVDANAALIAAAPEMYALLEDLLGKFRNDEFAPQIEAVLKKARGQKK